VKAVKDQAGPLDEQTRQWIVWAEQKINWMDPLLDAPEIFTDHDLEHYKEW